MSVQVRRGPQRAKVTVHFVEELQMELTALRGDVLSHCDFMEPRLDALYPVAIELGPIAHQLVAGALYSVASLRRKVSG